MRRLKCAVVATVAAISFASVASAADIPVKAPVYRAAPMTVAPSWTGWYIGGNAGYAHGNFHPTSNFFCPAPGCTYNIPANLAAVNAAINGSQSANGFTGGVQTGYNWQASNVVYGIEADFGALNLKSSQSAGARFPLAAASFLVSTSASTDWLLTLRGRLGLLVTPDVLLYGTGGLAVTDLKVSNTFTDNFAPTTFGSSNTKRTVAGWTIGGGVEWMLNPRWTMKAEYLYINFGSTTTTLTNNAPFGILNANQMTSSADLKAQIGRLGINYRF